MVVSDIDGVNNGDLPKNYMSQANQNVIIITGVMGAFGIVAVLAIVAVTGSHAESYDEGVIAPPASVFPPSPSSVARSSESTNASLAETAVSPDHPQVIDEGAQGPDQDVENADEDCAQEII